MSDPGWIEEEAERLIEEIDRSPGMDPDRASIPESIALLSEVVGACSARLTALEAERRDD